MSSAKLSNLIIKRNELLSSVKKQYLPDSEQLNYVNEWNPSDPEGRVVIIHFKKDFRYEGEINSSYEPNGYGSLFLPNKDFYFGEFINGKRNGIGEYYYNDGTVYIGNWKDDVKDGEGCLINPKRGWRFNGNFENDTSIDGVFHKLENEKEFEEICKKCSSEKKKINYGNYKDLDSQLEYYCLSSGKNKSGLNALGFMNKISKKLEF